MLVLKRNPNWIVIAIILMLLSCNNESLNKINDKETSLNPKIRFYYRVIGSNDGYYTYTDYVAVENYINKTYTVKQLEDVALKYSDTAKADAPISSITFVGEKKGTTLPPGMMKLYHLHAHYQIVSFNFNNSFKNSIDKKKIDDISIWKKGEASINNVLDSVLKKNELLDNGTE